MIGNIEHDDKKKPLVTPKGVSPGLNSGFSAKEMDKIRDMLERVVQIEERMLKIQTDLKGLNIQAMRD
jgi:hypothetical protein